MAQCLAAADKRLATGYGSECVRVRQDLAIAESQLRDYQARLGKPFANEVYLSELTALREQLKMALSGGNSESDDEEGPSAFGLADKIKALKSANSIEATPQRVRQKHSTAEEPVTARIRRRTEENTVAGEAVEQNAESKGGETLPTPEQASADKPPMTFQERIIQERQRKDDGQSPP